MTKRTIDISLFNHLKFHLQGRLPLLVCTKATLVHISHTLEDLVLQQQLPAILFTGFQESKYWKQAERRYRELTGGGQQVCIFAGESLPPESSANELHVTLGGDDPLRQEWFLCILSRRFSVVLCGEDCHAPTSDEATRQFATIWTFEPKIVKEVLDLLEEVVGRYRPERIEMIRSARARFPPVAPDPSLVTSFTRELIVFEEQLHQQIRASEARYRAVVNDQTELICRFGSDGRITFVNEAFAFSVGVAHQRLAGQNFTDYFRPQLQSGLSQQLANLSVAQPSLAFECENKVAGGDPRWQQWTMRAICDGVGAVVEFQAVGRDVTEQRRMELALQQTNVALQQANDELTARVGELQRRTSEIDLLGELSELLQACRDFDEAGAVVERCATQLFPNVSGALALLGPNSPVGTTIATWGATPPSSRIFAPDDCWALRRGRAHVIDQPDDRLMCRHCRIRQECGTLCIPMVARGEALGVLHIQWELAGELQESSGASRMLKMEQRLAHAVAEQAATALANLHLRERLREQVIRDPLTNLFNRRYLEETMSRELSRAARSRKTVGLMLLDIDRFKQLNDNYGHLAGDTVLREVGEFLRAHSRGEDVACRYGGEEFMLILPELSLEDTERRAQDILRGLNSLALSYLERPLGTITCSIGVAAYPVHGTSVEQLTRSADRALYLAKNQGRDRVVVSGGEPFM